MKKLLIIFLLMICRLDLRAQTPVEPDNDFDHVLNLITSKTFGASLSMASDTFNKKTLLTHTSAGNPANKYVFLNEAKTVAFFLNVPLDSASYYRYSLSEYNGKTIVTDRNLDHLPKLINSDDKYERVKLGRFNVDQKILVLKYYHQSNPGNVITTTIYNKPIEPARLKETVINYNNPKNEKELIVFLLKDKPHGFKLTQPDSSQASALMPMMDASDFAFLYHVYLKNLATGKVTHLGNNWSDGFFDSDLHNTIDVSNFQEPGKYEVSIIPADYWGDMLQWSFPDKAVRINFTVLEPDKTYTRKQVLLWSGLGIITAATIGTSIFILQKRRSSKRITQEKNQKLQAQMQLNAVRAQLNPHFIFNALAGIQNLMNRQETDQANRYLSKFARLTRSVLDSRDFITLADELALLNDYLEMEKLRFGFTYHINTDPALDAANLEIPAMLLQPLVENAVKHGVAGLGTEGLITLDLQKQDDYMLLSVTDNGKGFDHAQATGGLGLKLTHDRIKLLNELHPATPIELQIAAPGNGTRINITLKHWL